MEFLLNMQIQVNGMLQKVFWILFRAGTLGRIQMTEKIITIRPKNDHMAKPDGRKSDYSGKNRAY